MPQIRFGPCRDCGVEVMTRGRNVLNIHGTPLNHYLSCTAKQQELNPHNEPNRTQPEGTS